MGGANLLASVFVVCALPCTLGLRAVDVSADLEPAASTLGNIQPDYSTSADETPAELALPKDASMLAEEKSSGEDSEYISKLEEESGKSVLTHGAEVVHEEEDPSTGKGEFDPMSAVEPANAVGETGDQEQQQPNDQDGIKGIPMKNFSPTHDEGEDYKPKDVAESGAAPTQAQDSQNIPNSPLSSTPLLTQAQTQYGFGGALVPSTQHPIPVSGSTQDPIQAEITVNEDYTDNTEQRVTVTEGTAPPDIQRVDKSIDDTSNNLYPGPYSGGGGGMPEYQKYDNTITSAPSTLNTDVTVDSTTDSSDMAHSPSGGRAITGQVGQEQLGSYTYIPTLEWTPTGSSDTGSGDLVGGTAPIDSSNGRFACELGEYMTGSLTYDISCTKCSIGKYSDVSGASEASVCLDCKYGTYNNEEGQSACKQCGTNKAGVRMTAVNIGAVSSAQCDKFKQGIAFDCVLEDADIEAQYPTLFSSETPTLTVAQVRSDMC